jgi:hypothetical protein
MATSCTYVQRSGATVFSMTAAVGSRKRRSLREQLFAKIQVLEHKSTLALNTLFIMLLTSWPWQV